MLHKEGSHDWILQIKYIQERDAGDYECQVSKIEIQFFVPIIQGLVKRMLICKPMFIQHIF